MSYAFPTPTTSAVEIGPLTVHFYALCIIAAIAVAIRVADKRFTSAHSGVEGVVGDVAVIAVPFGVIGGRLYHIVTSPENYFGKNGSISNVFKIWEGGLGIWGAIALGAGGAYLAYKKRTRQIQLPPFSEFAGALAPGLLLAQAIGRWGNWFNGELFGRPLTAPWALEIPQYLRPDGFREFSTFHPTFLYESIWCTALAILLILLTSRLKGGAIFALYICGYSLGRFFIEGLRVDEAQVLGGFRLNQYVAALIFAAGLVAFSRNMRRTG
jgi:prolipoprotein diacylglyceryl transferase